jgi:hypothetical protein
MFFFLNFTYLIETHVQAALALDGSIRIAKLAIHYSLGGYYGGKNLYENIIVDDNIGILWIDEALMSGEVANVLRKLFVVFCVNHIVQMVKHQQTLHYN